MSAVLNAAMADIADFNFLGMKLSKFAASVGSEGAARFITVKVAALSRAELISYVQMMPGPIQMVFVHALRNESLFGGLTLVVEGIIEAALPTGQAAVLDGFVEGIYEGIKQWLDKNVTGDRDIFIEQLITDIMPNKSMWGPQGNQEAAEDYCIREHEVTDKKTGKLIRVRTLHISHLNACPDRKIEIVATGTLRNLVESHPDADVCTACIPQARKTTAGQIVIQEAATESPPDFVDLMANAPRRRSFELVRAILRKLTSKLTLDNLNPRSVLDAMETALKANPKPLNILPVISTDQDNEVREAVEVILSLLEIAQRRYKERRRLSGSVRANAPEAERRAAESATAAQRRGDPVLFAAERERLAAATRTVRGCLDQYEAFFAAVEMASDVGGAAQLFNDVRGALDNFVTNEGAEGIRDWVDLALDRFKQFFTDDLTVVWEWLTTGWRGGFLWVMIMFAVIGAPLTVFGFSGAIYPYWAPAVLWTTYFLICLTVVGASFTSRWIQTVLFNGFNFVRDEDGDIDNSTWGTSLWNVFGAIPSSLALGFWAAMQRWGLTATVLVIVGALSPAVGYLAFGPGRPMWFGLGFIGWVFILLFSMLIRIPDDIVNLPLRAGHALANRRAVGPIDRLSTMIAQAVRNRYGIRIPGDANNDGVPDNQEPREFKPMQIGRNIGTIFSLIASFLLVFVSGICELGIWWQLWIESSTVAVEGVHTYGTFNLFLAGVGNGILWNLGIWALTAEYRARSRWTTILKEEDEKNLLEVERGREILLVWRGTRNASIALILVLFVVIPTQMLIASAGVGWYNIKEGQVGSVSRSGYDFFMVGAADTVESMEKGRERAKARKAKLLREGDVPPTTRQPAPTTSPRPNRPQPQARSTPSDEDLLDRADRLLSEN